MLPFLTICFVTPSLSNFCQTIILFWNGVDLPPSYLDNVFKYTVLFFLTAPLTATNCDAAGRTNWQNFTEDDTDVREYEVISTWRVHSHMYITSTWFQPPASTAYVLSFPLAFLCHLSGRIPCYLAFKNILNLLLISISSTAYFLILFLRAKSSFYYEK